MRFGPVLAAAVRVGYIANDWYPDGTLCPWGRDARLAAELKIEEQGLELVAMHHSNGTLRGLKAGLHEMLDARVDAVLGADWSRVAVAAAEFLEPHGVPLISGGCTSSTLDTMPNVWRTIYSDTDVQPLLAKVGSLLAGRVGLLGSEDDFGRAGREVLRRSFAELGLAVVSEASFVSTANGAMVGDACENSTENRRIVQRAVSQVLSAGPSLVAVSATGPSTSCALYAKQQLQNTAQWITTEVIHENWTSPYGEQVKLGAQGSLTYIGTPVETKELRAFQRSFITKHGHSPDGWAGYAYDAAGLLASVGANVSALRDASFEGATGLISFPVNRSSPPQVRMTIQQFGAAGYEEAGASYALGPGQGVHLYLRRFMPRVCQDPQQFCAADFQDTLLI